MTPIVNRYYSNATLLIDDVLHIWLKFMCTYILYSIFFLSSFSKKDLKINSWI